MRNCISVASCSETNAKSHWVQQFTALFLVVVAAVVVVAKKSGTKVFLKFAQNLILCAHWPEVFIFEVLFRVVILFFEKNGF